MPAEAVYIGIGSNLGDPITFVTEAISGLDAIPNCSLIKQSSLYRSEPLGDISQDDYINAVALIHTGLTPMALLLELQAIEQAFYRQRDPAQKWAARTLDLDIILFGNKTINDSHLTIPHRDLALRQFVLQPLFEIAGDLYIPGVGSIVYLIKNAPAMKIDIISG